MSVLDAKKLNNALAKAKNVGLVEESFTIEDCEITLRNLRPDEYVASLAACQGLDDVAYLHTYQKEHLARSIVVLNGIDLHDVKYVEKEEPDPKHPEKSRTVKVELHDYLSKNVVSTWSREVVYTVYRKFSDVIEKAERKAKEGVSFLLPDETNEEKYRRLLLEAKECESDLPDSLLDHILEDHGLMRRTTAEEVKAAMERTDQLAREAEAKVAQDSETGTEVAPEKVEVKKVEEPEDKSVDDDVRQPLNQLPGKLPTDPHQTLQQLIEARRKGQGDSPSPVNRTTKIAALEAEAGIGVGEEVPVQEQSPQEVVEIRKQEPVDPKKVRIDQPPVAGINPRFRLPPKV
jgi:hypothetical protein